ncbi:flagellar basal body rod protein FlgB [Endozoicomonas ascidiicola]|uniref:flagellar basal body rod protein FlgB n=1 Tax=Endozoicomonas ascidiicola TaxID=1698521 RepID=UPI0008327DD8|nr:flagellar basal body rod protein FlgB [Endozoicomonas ascidiicola]
MGVNFDKTLGVHEQGLQLRGQRAEVISGNIANIDTPGYKAQDLDFKQVFQQQQNQLSLTRTRENHLSLDDISPKEPAVYERTPLQPSHNGNTVELGQEQAAFARNRMEYETSFTFLNMKVRGLERAINGQ